MTEFPVAALRSVEISTPDLAGSVISTRAYGAWKKLLKIRERSF